MLFAFSMRCALVSWKTTTRSEQITITAIKTTDIMSHLEEGVGVGGIGGSGGVGIFCEGWFSLLEIGLGAGGGPTGGVERSGRLFSI